MDRELREMQHFENLIKDSGYEWWGANTPAAKLRLKRRVDLIKQILNIKSQDKLLECGCGAGEFTSLIASELDKGILITAIDLSEPIVNLATTKVKASNVTFQIASVTNMPFYDNFFHYIIGNSILHHLDLSLAIKEIKRVLKPDGQILFFEPNLINPQVFLSFKVPFFRKLHQASPDEMAFHRWKIKKEFIYAGFTEIKVIPFDFMHPYVPKSLFSTIKLIESGLEKTFLREIAGSLIITAKKSYRNNRINTFTKA